MNIVNTIFPKDLANIVSGYYRGSPDGWTNGKNVYADMIRGCILGVHAPLIKYWNMTNKYRKRMINLLNYFGHNKIVKSFLQLQHIGVDDKNDKFVCYCIDKINRLNVYNTKTIVLARNRIIKNRFLSYELGKLGYVHYFGDLYGHKPKPLLVRDFIRGIINGGIDHTTKKFRKAISYIIKLMGGYQTTIWLSMISTIKYISKANAIYNIVATRIKNISLKDMITLLGIAISKLWLFIAVDITEKILNTYKRYYTAPINVVVPYCGQTSNLSSLCRLIISYMKNLIDLGYTNRDLLTIFKIDTMLLDDYNFVDGSISTMNIKLRDGTKFIIQLSFYDNKKNTGLDLVMNPISYLPGSMRTIITLPKPTILNRFNNLEYQVVESKMCVYDGFIINRNIVRDNEVNVNNAHDIYYIHLQLGFWNDALNILKQYSFYETLICKKFVIPGPYFRNGLRYSPLRNIQFFTNYLNTCHLPGMRYSGVGIIINNYGFTHFNNYGKILYYDPDIKVGKIINININESNRSIYINGQFVPISFTLRCRNWTKDTPRVITRELRILKHLGQIDKYNLLIVITHFNKDNILNISNNLSVCDPSIHKAIILVTNSVSSSTYSILPLLKRRHIIEDFHVL